MVGVQRLLGRSANDGLVHCRAMTPAARLRPPSRAKRLQALAAKGHIFLCEYG